MEAITTTGRLWHLSETGLCHCVGVGPHDPVACLAFLVRKRDTVAVTMTRSILGVSPANALSRWAVLGFHRVSHLWKLATVDDWYVGNAGSVVTVKRQEGHNDSSLLQNLRSVHSVYPGPSTHMAQQAV